MMTTTTNRRPLKTIVLVNLLTLLFWILGLGFGRVGFPYLNFLGGIVFFFLPGINLALFLAQITGRRLRIISLFLFGVLISFLLNPTIIYIFSLLFNRIGQEQFVLLTFLLYWIFSFVLLLLSCCWGKKHFLDFNFAFLKKHKVLLFAFSALIFVAGLGFLLYPYVPEADGYSYMVKIRDTLTYHRMPLSESRPLFFALVWLLLFLTKIPMYWLFKIVLPLVLFLVLALVFYSLSFSKIKNRLLLIVSSLAFLSCPVIFAEVLCSRPQTIFILVFVILLFVLKEFVLRPQAKDYLWLGFLLVLNVLGLKMHLFFVFNVLLILAVWLFSSRDLIKKYSFESAILFLFAILGSYPWLRDLGIMDQVAGLARPFIQTLVHPKFDLWFIDNYVNVDGIQMGWPGILQLYYYGYNLGIFLPCLFLFLVAVKQKTKIFFGGDWIWLLILAMFFSIAEIFPRLGVAFLPDRAWLYVSSILIFFVPTVLSLLEKKLLKKKVWFIVFMLSFVLSVLASLFVVYAKQGWVAPGDVEAAQFIKSNTSPQAVFVGQEANSPVVSFFGERLFVKASPSLFLEKDISVDTLNYFSNFFELVFREEYYLDRQQELLKKMREELDQLRDPYLSDYALHIKNLSLYQKTLEENIKMLQNIRKQKMDKKGPVYIIYSHNKFNSLYSIRGWWRTNNFYRANLDKFNKHPDLFDIVYNKNGVIIWKVKIE